ncbi:MAG: translocation/assembly module TamB domain-containing protein [Armatimonadetes bacterium]|nr:translocation/assembly module TamB domain-containing protein [Armatimonadota bacterium]
MGRIKRISLLVIIAPVILMAAVFAAFFVSRPYFASEIVRQAVVAIASQHINARVTIGSFHVSPTGKILLEDVKILGPEDSLPILSASRVIFKFRLLDFAFRRVNPIKSIQSVHVISPRLYLRRGKDGRWNIANLLKPTKPTAPFEGIIKVQSGRLTIQDLAHDPNVAYVNKLRSINAVVDFSNHPVAAFVASAVGEGDRAGKIHLEGKYDLGNRSFKAELDAVNLNAKFWSSYPKRLKFMKVLSGSVNAFLFLNRKKDQPLNYQVVLDLKDGKVNFSKIKKSIEKINGRLLIENDTVDMDLNSRIGATRFAVFGSVIGFKHPRLSLDFRSDCANLREFSHFLKNSNMLSKFNIPSSGICHLVAIGPARNPEISFEVNTPYLGYRQWRATDFHVIGVYKGGHINLAKAEGKAYGGKLIARGHIYTSSKPSVSLVGKATGVELAQIPSIQDRGLAASSNGHFKAHWTSDFVQIDYQGSLGSGSFRGFHFDDGAASIRYKNGQFEINEVSARVMGGLVSVSGKIGGDGTLNLSVSSADIDLAKFGRKYWRKPTVGRMYLMGRLTGTVENPLYEGRVVAQPVAVSGYQAERMEAQVTAGRYLLSLHDLVIHQWPGRITISGSVVQPLERTRSLNLIAKADSLDIRQLVHPSSKLGEVSGLLSADVSITILGSAPAFAGDVWIENGRIHNHILDLARAKIYYAGDTLALKEVSIHSGKASLKADASYTSNGGIRATFSGEGFQLADIIKSSSKYPSVSGLVNFQGTANGTIEQPWLDLALNGSDIKIDGEPFKQFAGNVKISEGKLSATNLMLTDANSSVKFPVLEYRRDEGSLQVDAVIEDIPFSKFLSITKRNLAIYDPKGRINQLIYKFSSNTPGLVTGRVEGNLKLVGGLKPNLHCEGTFSNSNPKAEAGQIHAVYLKGSCTDNIVAVNEFEAVSDEAVISGKASVGPADSLHLNLDAHGLNLTDLSHWLKLPHNISGTADVTIVAGGTTSQPVGQASVDIINPIIGNAKFDQLRLRLSTGEHNMPAQQVNIDELTLVLDQKEVTASGFIPVSWRPLSILEDNALSLKLVFDNAGLDLLPGFVSSIAKNSMGGILAGSVLINVPAGGGKLKTPTLQGDLTWTKGTIRFSQLDTSFQDIDMHCVLKGDELIIEKCTGISAKGGGFDIGGSIKFTELNPTLDLLVHTSSLGLSEKNLSNEYGESIRCRLDSTLKIMGDWRKPLVAGDIAVKDGSIDIAGKAEKSKGKRKQSVDPTFSVVVDISKSVELRSSRVKTPLVGRLNIAGSLSKPSVDGQANLTDGIIMFPMHTFKILPGSTMRLRIHPSEPPSVMIDVRAQTRLMALTGLGRRKRYTVTMEVSGPWDNLQPRFTASPPDLSEQRILAMVTGQQSIEQIFGDGQRRNIGEQLSGLFSAAMMPTVLGSIGDVVGEALGFEEFTLEMGYKEPLQLSISEQLLDGLYLNYSSTLGARPDYADSQYQFKLSYRLPKGVELGLSTNERKQSEITIEGKMKF